MNEMNPLLSNFMDQITPEISEMLIAYLQENTKRKLTPSSTMEDVQGLVLELKAIEILSKLIRELDNNKVKVEEVE